MHYLRNYYNCVNGCELTNWQINEREDLEFFLDRFEKTDSYYNALIFQKRLLQNYFELDEVMRAHLAPSIRFLNSWEDHLFKTLFRSYDKCFAAFGCFQLKTDIVELFGSSPVYTRVPDNAILFESRPEPYFFIKVFDNNESYLRVGRVLKQELYEHVDLMKLQPFKLQWREIGYNEFALCSELSPEDLPSYIVDYSRCKL